MTKIFILFMVSMFLTGCVSESTLRLMSYNIHSGVGSDGRFDMTRLAEVIQKADPDFVSLQEVDMGQFRSGGISMVDQLGDSTGLKGVFFPAIRGNFGVGFYGVAFLTRHPFKVIRQIHLPVDTGYEPRVAGLIRVESPRPFCVWVTHFSWQPDVDSQRLRAVQCLTRLSKTYIDAGCPVFLLGDLNAPMEAGSIRYLRENGWTLANDLPPQERCTFDALNPTVTLDYIGVQAKIPYRWLLFDVLEEKTASDHLPIVAEIVF